MLYAGVRYVTYTDVRYKCYIRLYSGVILYVLFHTGSVICG